MNIKAFSAFLVAAAMLGAPLGAQSGEDDLMSKVINAPLPESFYVNGVQNQPKPRRDDSVQGGKALRIAVPGKSAQAWDVSVSDPIAKPVKAGDQLVLAFWARLAKGEDGATSAQLPYNAVQLSREPYTAVFAGPATIGTEWKIHEVKGKADKDYAAGDLNVSLHLATGKQTIDIGPIFVLNMGQDGS